MKNQILLAFVCALVCPTSFVPTLSAQTTDPYPNALTDRDIHLETPMPPPAVNTVFTDPDFGSQMVRATDATTNPKHPGTFLRNEASGRGNEWNADGTKFYVVAKGGQVLAFGFNPATMTVTSLPGAGVGGGLLLPLRVGSFSFVDPDLYYGKTSQDQLTLTSYRFSTGVLTPVVDTRTCGMQPPLASNISNGDLSLSLDDSRMATSEGGPKPGGNTFLVVYDKNLGCRWYNTETGQIGGQWGPAGAATVGASYLVLHATLARSGNYVQISTNNGWYVWDIGTLDVTSCTLRSHNDCEGYGVVGYNSFVNSPGALDDMQIVMRPLNALSQISSLFYPLPSPANWGQEKHFTWSNVDVNDSVPACFSTYNYDGDTEIDQPFAGEILCIETDGIASTVWRFAHNRAVWTAPYFQTQPLGNVSNDGHFFLFTSGWDAQLGLGTDGTPRSDVFIVKLD